MVLPDSHGVSRAPWYSGTASRKPSSFRLQDFHLLWSAVPSRSTSSRVFHFPASPQRGPTRTHYTGNATLAGLARHRFRLFPFRSPLLRESRLLSFPGGTEMVQFPPFAPPSLWIQEGVTGHDSGRVAPFGNPRVKACSRLTGAYRSLLRPSSLPRAKASTVRP